MLPPRSVAASLAATPSTPTAARATWLSPAEWHRGAPITLRIQGRELRGLPEPVAEDKQAVAAGLAQHLRKVPGDARYYGVTIDDHRNPNAEEVEKAAQSVVMVRIQLC